MANLFRLVSSSRTMLIAQQRQLAWQSIRSLAMVQGDLSKLAPKVRRYVEENAALCQPANIHVCDGSEAEDEQLHKLLQQAGQIKPLPKYKNCWLARTDPHDVARVESKTVICTPRRRDTIPDTKDDVPSKLGHWMDSNHLEHAVHDRFPGCMKGRTMFVIPYSMGPVGSPLSKVGIQITDSAYVVISMRIMTRMGGKVLDVLGTDDFVRCLHSVGQPLPMTTPPINNWPCDPHKTMIAHVPSDSQIISFGSGYGGNSLLGKKCFALRIGSTIARREGWLAEHMLILGITNPKGQKKYIAAAFPSACGKTNLAMLNPTIPGYKVECVGDDIAWMRFDDAGNLRAINPEAGFFGVAPGTSMKTNPNAMKTVQSNTIFTNVAELSNGGFWWEGLEKEVPIEGLQVTDWKGNPWTAGKTPAAHPNSRFCTPANQCPIMDDHWESPNGVPISAILFGGRRPEGVPLVYEAFDWKHGVLIGASMRSEATAAAEHAHKVVMNDPFAMRPFFGYNFGEYLSHWLSMNDKPGRKLPKIFHVNWFRKNADGKFIWPGFGENSRVLDWILRRVDNEDCAVKSAIGYLPKENAINMEGVDESVDMAELFRLPKDFWQQEVQDTRHYFDEQVYRDLPPTIAEELNALEQRVNQM